MAPWDSIAEQRGTLSLGIEKILLVVLPEGLALTLGVGVSRFSCFSYEAVGWEEELSLKIGLKLSPACCQL